VVEGKLRFSFAPTPVEIAAFNATQNAVMRAKAGIQVRRARSKA
jgi:hypothetical protein